MSKKVFAVFLLACALYAYCYAYTNVVQYKPTYGYLINNANFRTNPSTSGKVHKVIPKDTNIKILGEVGDYHIVQTNEDQIGYISKSLIKKDATRKPANASPYINVKNDELYTSKNGLINIRNGPSTSHSVISKMNEQDKVKVIGQINDFKLVVTTKNNVGMVKESLLKKAGTAESTPEVPGQNASELVLITGSKDEAALLDLINNARAAKGLPKLKLAKRLTEIARIKSEDMVKNNYFSHESKIYGSPFKMLKDFGIDYKEAGENIAGNPSIKGAFDSWMDSPTHSENIYSNAYNYVGIGIANSKTYGYVITAIFIGK